MNIVVVVGNPKPQSRTRDAAVRVASGLDESAVPDVIELADLGPALLHWGNEDVAAAKTKVLAADALVFASPTYKATYTGLLKLFIDQFGQGELEQTPTFVLMLGASLRHALAPELTLRPVLTEIGASCPAPALFVMDSSYETDGQIEAWLEIAKRHLGRLNP